MKFGLVVMGIVCRNKWYIVDEIDVYGVSKEVTLCGLNLGCYTT